MKKLLERIKILFCIVLLMSPGLHARSIAVARKRAPRVRALNPKWHNERSIVINRLSRFESAAGKYTSQVTFEFSRHLHFKAKETIKGQQIKLYFPGMQLSDFTSLDVEKKLKELAIVHKAMLRNEKSDDVLIPSPTITIDFVKDSALLRVARMEEPNLLVLDIFDRSTIRRIESKVTTILKASNKVHDPGMLLCMRGSHPDFPTMAKKKRVYNCLRGRVNPKKLHIVVDAGHGGKDPGASSFGIKEKSLTLDIARHVYSMLKQEGYRVFLTRNTDSYLSVVDRFELAQQLKADLFVSVHVNAAGLGHISGVETHFLDGSAFTQSIHGRRSGCEFFLTKKSDAPIIKSINKLLQHKINASGRLSTSIQNSILSCLRSRNIDIENRGIKRTGFRTLLRSEVPSSIVEVGFITNKKEAKRLTKHAYRNFLAKGICDGIKRFIYA